MNTHKRTTVYFEPELLDALRLRAAADEYSISTLVNEALRTFLAKDLADRSAVTEQLDTVYGAPGADKGLDPVVAGLQFATLARHSGH